MANEFIWHLPTEAQQAMSYAANAAKADLAKQENMLRMAELGMRRQQAQQTAELNRLITQSQIGQQEISNRLREREINQRGELARAQIEADKEIARMPSQRETEFNRKLQLEEADRKRAEEDELRIVTDAERTLDELNKREVAVKGLKQFGDAGRKDINMPSLSSKLYDIATQRQAIIDGMARSGYQFDPTTGKFIGVKRPSAGISNPSLPNIPTASQLQQPPAPQMSFPQMLAQPPAQVPSFVGLPAPPAQDNLPRYETVQQALAAGHKSGDIVRVKHPVTGVYARYQIE